MLVNIISGGTRVSRGLKVKHKLIYMENQWTPPLDKCVECQKPFSKGQEYWELVNKKLVQF